MMRPIVFQVNLPAQPYGLTATVTPPTSARLTWSYLQGPLVATHFRILRNSAVIATVPATTLSYVDNTGALGQTYNYQVQALNATSTGTPACANPPVATTTCSITLGAPSNSVSVTFLMLAPYNLKLVSNTRSFGTTIGWNIANSSGLTRFDVYRQMNNGGFSVVSSTPVTSGTVTYYTNRTTGLTTGATYQYYVVAVAIGGGTSAPSNTITVVGP